MTTPETKPELGSPPDQWPPLAHLIRKEDEPAREGTVALCGDPPHGHRPRTPAERLRADLRQVPEGPAPGAGRAWFQDKSTPHYDICQTKRAKANPEIGSTDLAEVVLDGDSVLTDADSYEGLVYAQQFPSADVARLVALAVLADPSQVQALLGEPVGSI